MNPAQKALARHRKRSQALNTLSKSITMMENLPIEIFSAEELAVIHQRYASLMLAWLNRSGFEVHYEQ